MTIDRRDFLATCAAMVSLGSGLAACSPGRPLRVAVHPWIGYETLYIARDFHWLPEAVALQSGEQMQDSVRALESGAADAAALTLDEAMRVRARGLPVAVIAVFDVSAGGDVVLGRKGVTSVAALKGARVALTDSTLSHLVLNRALDVAGLSVADVTLLYVDQMDLAGAWDAGLVDAIVTYEPVASLLARGDAVRLFDSRQMPDTIFDVLALRPGRLINHRAVFALLRAHFRALRHIRVNRQDALYRIATHQGLTLEETRRVLGGVRLPDLAANRQFLARDSSLAAAVSMLNDYMVRSGLLVRPDGLVGLFDSQYLPDEMG